MNDNHTPARDRIQIGSAILWASGCVLAALIIMQAGRLAPNPAYADMAASSSSGFSIVTSSNGQGPPSAPYENLYIIDNTEQVLYIYTIPNATSPGGSRLELLGGNYLPQLFRAAR